MELRSANDWEALFSAHVLKVTQHESEAAGGFDPAHDHAHFMRVVKTAKELCHSENARLEIVIPAAWLHDLVNVPKNDPRRSQASKLSADAALKYLGSVGYPDRYFPEIRNAIEAHSFSARIEPTSLEAEIVQDADRLDGLGAIGIARMFLVGGILRRPIYEGRDPFCEQGRVPDDLQYTIDHFYVKLFKTAETLRTRAGRDEGKCRADFMRDYLKQLQFEVQGRA